MTKPEVMSKDSGYEKDPKDELVVQTNYPFISRVFYVLLTVLVIWIAILLLKGALEFFYPEIFGFSFFLLMIYVFMLHPIRIYTFYNDYITIHVPYRITSRHRIIEVAKIERIIYSRSSKGSDHFIFKLKGLREYRIPYNHNRYWDNSFSFALRYFKKRNIPLNKLGLFGRVEYFDNESDI